MASPETLPASPLQAPDSARLKFASFAAHKHFVLKLRVTRCDKPLEFSNLPNRKTTADHTAWVSTGNDARYLARFRRLLAKTGKGQKLGQHNGQNGSS